MAVAPSPAWCQLCASACANASTTCNETGERCGGGADQALACGLGDVYTVGGGLSPECGAIFFYVGYCASAMDRCDDAATNCEQCFVNYCAGTGGGGGGKLF